MSKDDWPESTEAAALMDEAYRKGYLPKADDASRVGLDEIAQAVMEIVAPFTVEKLHAEGPRALELALSARLHLRAAVEVVFRRQPQATLHVRLDPAVPAGGGITADFKLESVGAGWRLAERGHDRS